MMLKALKNGHVYCLFGTELKETFNDSLKS